MSDFSVHLPKAYDTREGSDTKKLIDALAKVLGVAKTHLEDALDDRFAATADGEGLDRLGEGYAITKPPHLSDAQYRILIQTKLPARRGTLQAIRAVFEAASGVKVLSIADKQVDPLVPKFEIWITLEDDAHGRAAWTGLRTNTDGWPVESGVAGPLYEDDSDPYYQGLFNDYYWGITDVFTQNVVDGVRLAGTRIVYKLDEDSEMVVTPTFPEIEVSTTQVLTRALIIGKTVKGDTSSGVVALTLPPTIEMGIGDDGRDFYFYRSGGNNLTIASNTGQSIVGGDDPFILTSDGDSLTLRFLWNGGAPKWLVLL